MAAKLAKLKLSTDILERIITAKDNDFVQTNAPQDMRIVKVLQDQDDQANHMVTLVVESVESDWPEVVYNGPDVTIPMLDPFEYTVVDPDEDLSPPTTEETPDG